MRVSRPGHLHLRTGSRHRRHRLASNHAFYGADAAELGGNALINGSHATQSSMVRHNLHACACGSVVLLRWRANQKVTAQCASLLCAGDQCSCGQAFTAGLTPPEFAARHMDDSEEIVGVLNSACSTKRKRRGTPMKERAVKAGIFIPPTPDGIIRAPLADESPATKKKRLRQLQHHQTACQ